MRGRSWRPWRSLVSLKRALAVEFYATQNPGTSLRSAHVSTAGSVVSQTQVTRYQTLLPSRVAPERKRDQTTFSQMAETVVSQFQSRDWETDLWLLVTPTMGAQLAAYAARNGNSVLIVFASAGMVSGRCFETDCVQQIVQVVDDALIQSIELRTLRIGQGRVSPKRLEQACG